MKTENKFILDCSVTMAWCFEDESDEFSLAILEKLQRSQALVPSLWSLEVANVLLIAQRKKRVTKNHVDSFIQALGILPIHIDTSTHVKAMHQILALAHETNLTIYDATYLELAIREELPLATLDKHLQNVAKRYNRAFII